ncbi:MAG: carboxyltransferase domain-containing protein, partial [Chitinophagales bacterium]
MEYPFSYRIFPLGDSALTLDFGNTINETINKEVLALFHSLKQQDFPGIKEMIPAYSSLSIFYDVFALRQNIPGKISVFEWMKEKLENLLLKNETLPATDEGKHIRIPVCYDDESGTDINKLAEMKNLSKEEIIQLHTGTKYRVYMLGFLPGFPYLGKTDKRIA